MSERGKPWLTIYKGPVASKAGAYGAGIG